MSNTFEFTVGLGPPSVNSYVRHSRGRHFKTKKAQEFSKAVQWHLALYMPVGWDCSGTSYSVSIYYEGRIDVDNAPKVILDSMQGYAYADDGLVDELIVRRSRSKNRSTRVVVTKLA